MTTTITRFLEFDAGHRLLKHAGKCRHLHGHRYKVEVTCQLVHGAVDAQGMVIDFGTVKTHLGGWIDTHLDHGLMVEVGDALGKATEAEGLKVFWMTCAPTAENLAALLLKHGRALLVGGGVSIQSITVWETPNCFATVHND